jgi:hypothetical protein
MAVPAYCYLGSKGRIEFDYEIFKGTSKLFFQILQIANPQILALIPLSQIRKFLSCARPQFFNGKSANYTTCCSNPQIDHP